VALHKAGKSATAIAAMLALSPQSVRLYCQRAGVDLAGELRERERANRERFVAAWNAAAHLGDAATSLGMSETCARPGPTRSESGSGCG
jgi:hypothetical protein